MTPREIMSTAIAPALRLLPMQMDSQPARVQLLATSGQEANFEHRRQIGGPARGLWQFEKGTRASRGGVWGVYLHQASRKHLEGLCGARSVRYDPDAIYAALEYDDVLAAGVARLLLWTDPARLPDLGDVEGAWGLYLRCWRPGAYTNGDESKRQALRTKWGSYYAQALAEAAS